MSKKITLSPREIQVLKLVCNEKISSEIAALLKVTVNTIDFHRTNIYKKTKAKSTIGLFKYALKRGIIQFKF